MAPGATPVIGGLARSHASVEGNALAACCRLCLGTDQRAGDALDEMITLNALRILRAAGRLTNG